MHIDKPRARKVFALMLAQYQARQHPFLSLQTDRPQHHVPASLSEDPLQLARFLFYLCLYMRGGIDSVHAAKQLSLVYGQHPWLFTSEVLVLGEEDIAATVAPYIPLFRERIGRFWLHNARVLWERYDGDPRLIFDGVKSAPESYYRTMGVRYRPSTINQQRSTGELLLRVDGATAYQGFRGFREKMTSMIAYYLFDMKLIKESPPLSAPIDYHHLRMNLQTGMIVVAGTKPIRYEQLVPIGIELALYLQQHFKLPMHEYGDIVWLWSKILCGQAPQNRSVVVTDNPVRVTRAPAVLTWDEADREAFAKSCGECAVREECRFSVPSGEYYTQGQIRLIPRRDPPKIQPLLFAIPALPKMAKR